MIVEKLKSSDRNEWSMLYEGYAEFYKMPMNDDILDKVWSWIFDKEIKFYAIGVKSSEGELIGFMHFREMPSPLRGSLVGFLDDLYIHPDFRGSGAVQLLFKELKSIAKANNWPYVRWITASDNHRARKVYDKLSGVIDFVTYQMQSS
ncbi:GNAT family N-acetyltransferase [Candidatus Thioglobus sp. NP1]|uniref:GNAT family N-acetyltransferase n=1 Tax=Candidatus Thioglobus sp. NP1 TaxID=2508687 RepID=UPI000DEDAECF|nr:GNAT family N-acetyltransferase [Candidatus Thioglobus sp. NP1]AXE61750.1 GNAT family N-acetyltransferase [Candidatus Thioglobus sp. NP1]